MRWSEAKRALQGKTQPELFKFIKTLYDLNANNRAAFEAALGPDRSRAIDLYKREITKAIDPTTGGSIELRRGRKAISDFRKLSPTDVYGQIDLMLHFVESGTHQTLTYGDMDGPFYDSMCSMIDKILDHATKLNVDDHARIAARFEVLDDLVRNQIGWGFSDYIAAAVDEIENQDLSG